jgi:hypothetical protein
LVDIASFFSVRRTGSDSGPRAPTEPAVPVSEFRNQRSEARKDESTAVLL